MTPGPPDIRRVVLVGAESTGKTTLARNLAEHFETVWVPEYAREHWVQKLSRLTEDDPPPAWTPDEFVHIAREQQTRERALAGVANRVLFCDTNAFATGTWFERYHRRRHPEVDAIGESDRADLYLIPTPDVLFVQDGFRDGEAIRGWMHGRFVEQLAGGPTPACVLRGSHPERLATAIEAVEGLLRDR